MIKRAVLLIILIYSGLFCVSQNSNIDSLSLSLKSAKEDTTKVNILNRLFLEYEFTDAEKARTNLEMALKLAKDIDFRNGLILTYKNLGFLSEDAGNAEDALENHQASLKIAESIGSIKDQISAYNNIGIIYASKYNYPEALKNYSEGLQLSMKTGNNKGISRFYNNMANVYRSQGNYPEALKGYFASLKINELLGDQKGISATYNNIGIIYKTQGNYTMALKNYERSLKINEADGDKKNIATSYNNIANVFQDQGDYEKALKNHFMALKIRQEVDEKEVADSYSNIANIYYFQSNYAEALKYYLASLKIAEKYGNIAVSANIYNNLGVLYSAQKKYNDAKASFQKAKELASKIGHKEYLRNIYKGLTDYYNDIGDYRAALEDYELYILYRDSLTNEETRKQAIESQMTYEFDKKEAVVDAEHKKELENQKVLAEEKSRKQNIIIIFVGIGLVLVLVFAGFVFRSLSVTRKQKNIIELQKAVVEEHQKEIIDSITYAKRLQQAILPSEEELKKYLPDSFVLYLPKDIVAGDFYWLHVSGDNIYIAAADSTGHGVPGAMVSVVCSNALNRAVDEFKLTDPGAILDKTRELVLETFAKSGEEIKDGMDISLLCINKSINLVTWSGANNQLWFMQNNSLKEIKANKQAIGKTDDPKPFMTHSIELNTGDVYYLMTDGYPDQFGGPNGKKYKYKPLEEKLTTISHLPLIEQQEMLTSNFNNWKGDLEQVDDVTIIGIKV